jgi:hypothetical protein
MNGSDTASTVLTACDADLCLRTVLTVCNESVGTLEFKSSDRAMGILESPDIEVEAIANR